jgi:pyrimidine-specific ribonucleoside hydrolase
VACGREKPLQGDTEFPAAWRAGVEKIRGVTLPKGGEPSALSAVELIAQTIQSSPAKVSVLTLGPLTNLGEAVQSRPEIIQNIAMVYIMGGAVDVPGNVSGKDGPEWNIYVDPHAANLVLDSKAPVTLVPLDATNHVPITSTFYASLKENHAAPAADAVYKMFSASTSMYTGGMYFWDPLTAAVLTDESLASIETRDIHVVEDGTETGRTAVTTGGASIRVAVSADAKRFEEVFLKSLNGQ